MSNTPGHYHAEGDPPDTVRYWDGTQWVGDPMPAPPTASTPPPPPPGGAAAGGGEKFGGLGIRIGAALIDFVIVIIASLILVGIFFATSDGDGFTATADTGGSIIIGLVIYAIWYLWLVIQFGGTPGKLILGLRIVQADAETPVDARGAFMRSLPALLGQIPFLGIIISLGAAIGSIITISNDAETRQSVYDKIGSTRVIRT